MRYLFPAFLALFFCSPVAFGAPTLSPFDLGLAKPYTIIQLGNEGGDSTSAAAAPGGNKLEITSNSSVFGSTLKGVDDADEDNKIDTSKVTGSWDKEDGVDNDISSSSTGSPGPTDDQGTLSTTDFNAIAADAVAASAFWAGQAGTSLTVNLDSGATLAIPPPASTGGANVFNLTNGFTLNSGSKITLGGGPEDFYVFNIAADASFLIQSNSIIELTGDIEASEVLFNVLGNIAGNGPDDALIGGGSIFQGTLLAPGRKVEVTTNHFHTMVSGGLPDSSGGTNTNAPSTTEITAADAIAQKAGSHPSRGGLFGQIIAGGTINWTASDISHQPFMTMPAVPIPSSMLLMGTGLAALIGWNYRKSRKS